MCLRVYVRACVRARAAESQRSTCVPLRPVGSYQGPAAVDALSAMLAVNFVLRAVPGVVALGAELGAHYRVPRVRWLVRTRVMCQAGRAGATAAAGARGEEERGAAGWLCERAPLWVVVQVCALLRDYS